MKKAKIWLSIILSSIILSLSACGEPSETVSETTEQATTISIETESTTEAEIESKMSLNQ